MLLWGWGDCYRADRAWQVSVLPIVGVPFACLAVSPDPDVLYCSDRPNAGFVTCGGLDVLAPVTTGWANVSAGLEPDRRDTRQFSPSDVDQARCGSPTIADLSPG